MNAAFHRSLLTGLACWLLSGCAGIEGPAVVDMVRTIDNTEGITSDDYEQLTDISDLVFQQIRDLDPQIYPQLTLFTNRNFVQHIRQRTQSGFGPDLIVTDSETALELYRQKLIDPISLSKQDRQDTPRSLLDLVTAEDGALVARPVQQFVQLACFNKSRLPTPPSTLEELSQSSRDAVVVGAAYHHEPSQVIAILEAVAKDHDKVLPYPAPAAFTVDFADSSINYKLLFWVRNPLEAFAVGSDLRQSIWTAFEKTESVSPSLSGRCTQWNGPHPRTKPCGSVVHPRRSRRKKVNQSARRRR